MDTPTTAIGPGLGAFVAFFLLALFLWFLMRNMNARMRRMAYAERDRIARLDAEVLAQEAQDVAKEAAQRGGGLTGTSAGGSGPAAPNPSVPPAEQAGREPGTPSA